MSAFSEAELACLTNGGQRRLARLATVGADGTPHVVPVGWSYNAEHDAIDVRGAAEAIRDPRPVIRIHPEPVVSWGLR
jgi:pyridoxamine 5'-phosphate oxidase family protein